MTYSEFEQVFPTRDACLDFLRDRYYAAGTPCPKCSKPSRFHRITGRSAYSCQFCGHHVYPTAGTIYHRSTTSLQLWFWAVHLVSASGAGLTARQLARELGVTDKTARRMLTQIRTLADPESESTDVAEALGGKPVTSVRRGTTSRQATQPHDAPGGSDTCSDYSLAKGRQTRSATGPRGRARVSGRRDMHRRRSIAVLAVVAVALLVTVAGLLREGGSASAVPAVSEGDMPRALAAHLEKLRASIPGNGGEAEEGPGSAGADEFFQRAYPMSDISLAKMKRAHAAASAVQTRSIPRGPKARGTWIQLGPSKATYQLTDFRSDYVPNQYVAGGRTTTMAMGPTCSAGNCRVWIGAAGGGIWRTNDALAQEPEWTYLSESFAINSTGSIEVDPNDPTGNTIWVGTGEPNACGSGCAAGVGLYKSTDGGDTWTGPIGNSSFNARGVGSIKVKPGDPSTIYAASGRAVLGNSSVCCNGAVSIIPGAPQWGLYKSTNGGQSWTFIHNGSANEADCTGDANEAGNLTPCSPRGVRRIAIDPSDPDTIYAASYARGIWRSTDAGDTWSEIKPSLDRNVTTMRPDLSVTELPNGDTRMYAAEGGSGTPYSRLFRSDDVATGTPTFTDLTSSNPADDGYGSYNYCTGQCWYDNFVFTPKGRPDVVYLGGSYLYGEDGGISNGRGVLLSTDAGVSFTDQTKDATDPSQTHPHGIHPDQHFILVHPDNPFLFWEASDGGIMRSSGEHADVSADCDTRGLSEPALSRCKQLLSRVPTRLNSVNKGLMTLQFMSLSVSPHNLTTVQGGTQDNGTFETRGNRVRWLQTIWGDGGQSGFDAVREDFRFHTFFGASPDVNFNGGEIADWNWIGDPLQTETAGFYIPIISDPIVRGHMYAGTQHVWRTTNWGLGEMSIAKLREVCNEWTGTFTEPCGDWVPLGDASTNGQLTSTGYGADRTGGIVAAVERTPADKSTMWAATSAGRVFVSSNVRAQPETAVTFTRIDTLSADDPGRFITGIYIDPQNVNHALISYSGFSASTPDEPGHVFDVVYDPKAGTATWTSLDGEGEGSLGDLPVTDIVRDDQTGDLYISSDFGVYMEAAGGGTNWTRAAPGLPNVEVTGLTLVPSERRIYAATHGLSAWLLKLP